MTGWGGLSHRCGLAVLILDWSMATVPPAPPLDRVIEAYKAGIDRTLLRENLGLTPTERVERLMELQRLAAEARRSTTVSRAR